MYVFFHPLSCALCIESVFAREVKSRHEKTLFRFIHGGQEEYVCECEHNGYDIII